MKKISLALVVLVAFVLTNHCRSTKPLIFTEVEHYRIYSADLLQVIQEFSDTCAALYGCTNLKKLSFSPTNFYDSIGEIDVTAELLIHPESFSNRVRVADKVILMVDSFQVLVTRSLAEEICMSDSIIPLGSKLIEWDYGEFESCLHKYGVVMTMKFSCFKEKKPVIYYYGAYIPPQGKKKLKKDMGFKN